MWPRSIGRLNGDRSGRVGILGGDQSIKKNLKTVRVMSIVAMWMRKLLMKMQYVFFEFFVSSVPPAKSAVDVKWVVLWEGCHVNWDACSGGSGVVSHFPRVECWFCLRGSQWGGFHIG